MQFLSFVIGVCSATLTILSPESVRQHFTNGSIKYSLGNFGFFPYGQSLTTNLDLAVPYEACSELQQKKQTDVQSVLVGRGNCTFAEKTRLAEAAGYSLVVVADSTDENIDQILMIAKNDSANVNIPTVLISQRDGKFLQKHIQSNKQSSSVLLKLQFEAPKETDVVSYEFWMSSLDYNGLTFIQQFHPFQKLFGNKLQFTPRYSMWEKDYCKAQNFEVRSSDCLSGGRYCDFDPDHEGPLEGRDTVLQNLRQMCIFKLHPQKWWDYVKAFRRNCIRQSEHLEHCSISVQKSVSIDNSKVLECMYSGFQKKHEADISLDDNSMLKAERQAQIKEYIDSYPMLVVNNEQYRAQGSLTIPMRTGHDGKSDYIDTKHYGPLQMICKSFSRSSVPQICRDRSQLYLDEDGNLVWIQKYFKQIERTTSAESNVILWIFVVISLVIVMLLVVYCYRRAMRRAMQQEMTEQVNFAISQYFSLNDKERGIELRGQ